MPDTILVVEDESILARNIKTFLERKGYDAVVAGTVADGLAKYAEYRPDAVLVDYSLPDGTGADVIRSIRADDRAVKLIVITAYGSVDIAVETMKAGADDYLTKPVSLDELFLLIQRLLSQSRTEQALSYYRKRERQQSGFDLIRGESKPIQALKERMRRVIATDEQAAESGQAGPPVLILGSTGTGKELVARALHYDGPRRSHAFIEVNCAALPEQLVESELFGHEPGSFTGAKERSQGLFRAAEGGTLFLDEIGEMPLALQTKMLKAIEDRQVRPVGSARGHRTDVRILAASNAPLEEKIQLGEFRADLFYRLNTVTIETPALRARGNDILELAEIFRMEFERRYGRESLAFDDSARQAMLNYYWPGNVRELRNVVEQAVMLCVGGTVTARELKLREPSLVQEDASPGDRRRTLPEAEKQLITDALKRHRGNVSMAARALGISRDTLRYRMDRIGLSRTGFTG